jgi:hypothetical protein
MMRLDYLTTSRGSPLVNAAGVRLYVIRLADDSDPGTDWSVCPFYGRQLFWLFVGAVGFMLALTVAHQFLIERPEWQVLIIGLTAGMLGALCALALERVAVTVAGCLAGGAITVHVLHVTGFDGGQLIWLFILAGGVLGALVVAKLFDWALIVLSSGVGAALVADCVSTHRVDPALLFIVLLAVGIVTQARRLPFDRHAGARR